MQRRRRVIVSGVILFLVITGSVSWLAVKMSRERAQERFREETRMVPATEVRDAVRNLLPSQIAYIDLDGLDRPPGSVTVRDPKTITLLLNGLKVAMLPKSFGWDGNYSVFLVLKNGKTVGQFAFNAKHKRDCFSPEFIRGLKAAGVSVGN